MDSKKIIATIVAITTKPVNHRLSLLRIEIIE
ncbi:hypothetical protein swp_0751 [Shewanella piezotolerans WP3]|uniref:Uncharacterized protein n=1 Tax=Shewanella piezotolerans (strain WP3 / JCM 13877) TaxID=225849 RepID=B8CIT9_SHEPW|nr:hypothetical protein swp_0751 [Shewanella piezotolerans WP3]